MRVIDRPTWLTCTVLCRLSRIDSSSSWSAVNMAVSTFDWMKGNSISSSWSWWWSRKSSCTRAGGRGGEEGRRKGSRVSDEMVTAVVKCEQRLARETEMSCNTAVYRIS